eukprot:CAMPEP_0168733824 /NCGR_PEP_ID=MMETSP0724-20121128/8494_1 /TAXON_ID=265536 /ORGANISM="Amphiprora sp., Strain CCMP467" /LENGTH=554 /DNA_ID=CAMNT_0008780903 /DNA_START=32 /DNA_END=1696 /DNA_ORIENTATION=+
MMGQQQLHEIVTPHDHDVLSGRGNFVNYHAGNEHFRSLVRKHKVAYVACPKQQKGKFSRLIVEEIRARNPPGRFLKQDPVTKLWHDIGEKKALDKTRQALREGAPEIMKEINGDEEPPSSPKADHVESQNKVETAREKSPPPEQQPLAAPVLSGGDLGSNHHVSNNSMQRGSGPQQMGGDGFGNVGGPRFDAGSYNNRGIGGSATDLPPIATSSQFSMQQQQPQQIPGATNDMMGHANAGGFQQQGNMVPGRGGGGFTPNNSIAQNNNNNNNMAGNPGLGTIADLRSRMQQQQQQQRQFGVFSIGNPQTTSMGPPGMAASSSSSGQSLQQKLASLAQLQQDMYQQQQQLQQQQEALMDQQQNGVFEFEPRPIAPGNEPNHVLPPVRSIGIESNQPPRKEQSHGRAAGAMDRQASEKSLEMDHIFEKAIHGGESEKDKMGASNASAMSISLGDMNADVDDPSSSMKPPPNRTFNLQEERQQNPNDLAERFNNSMKIKNQQQPAQKSGPEGFDMSVGTLGDSGNLFGNSNASMAFSEGSFGDIFDDNEKEAIVSSS